MDLEEQGSIQRLVEGGERERMVVLLGTPTAGSTVMVALTLTQGDPSYAGPLAGVPLGLPVYDVLDDGESQRDSGQGSRVARIALRQGEGHHHLDAGRSELRGTLGRSPVGTPRVPRAGGRREGVDPERRVRARDR